MTKVQGNKVWSGEPRTTTGESLSIVGSKRLVVTDLPAVYLEDSGGLLGERQRLAITGAKLDEVSWRRLARTRGLSIECSFGDGVSAHGVVPEAAADRVRSLLRARQEPDVVEQCCVRIEWSAPAVQVLEALVAKLDDSEPDEVRAKAEEIRTEIESGELDDAAEVDAVEYAFELAAESAVAGFVFEVLTLGVAIADVGVTEGRLWVREVPGDEVIVSLPLDMLSVQRVDDSIRVEAVAELLGQAFKSLELVPSSSADTERLLALLGGGGARAGVVASVAQAGRRLEVTLDADRLVIRAPEGLVRTLDLADPTVRLVLDGPLLLVGSESEPAVALELSAGMLSTVLANDSVRTVMKRPLEPGPFLTRAPAGGVRRVRLVGSQLLIDDGAPQALSQLQGLEFALEPSGLKLQLRFGNEAVEFVGAPSVLEALATAVVAEVARTHGATRIEPTCDAIARLERTWLITSVVGPFAALHRRLLARLETSELATPVEPERQRLLLALFAESIVGLRQHLDVCIAQLAPFVARREAQFVHQAFGRADPLERTERVLQQSLSGLSLVARQLDRVEREVSQLESMRRMLARSGPGLGGLGVSLALGFINPLIWLASVQQAVALSRASEQKDAAEVETLADAASAATREWNHLMRVAVPALLEKLLSEGVAPLLSTVRLAREALKDEARRPELLDAVAKRFASLRVFALLPAELAGTTNAELADSVLTLAQRAEVPFHAF